MKPVAVLCALIAFAPCMSLRADEPVLRVEPRVIEMGVPRYPALAGMAGISGVVKFFVRTDGHQIDSVLKSEGPPMLVRELGKYLTTWKFEAHPPEQFEITFKMKVTHDKVICSPEPDEIKLILPSYVEMTHASVSECDPVVTTTTVGP